ncbi:MAG: two-component sensor histidine kinase, partial [Myxococcota bacterium]
MDSSSTTLRAKLLAAFVLPTLGFVALYALLAYAVARSGLEEELGRRLLDIGQTVASEYSGGIQAKQMRRLDATKERTLKRLG